MFNDWRRLLMEEKWSPGSTDTSPPTLGRAKANMNHTHISSAVSAGSPNFNTKEKEKQKGNLVKKRTKKMWNLLIRNHFSRILSISPVSLNTNHIWSFVQIIWKHFQLNKFFLNLFNTVLDIRPTYWQCCLHINSHPAFKNPLSMRKTCVISCRYIIHIILFLDDNSTLDFKMPRA